MFNGLAGLWVTLCGRMNRNGSDSAVAATAAGPQAYLGGSPTTWGTGSGQGLPSPLVPTLYSSHRRRLTFLSTLRSGSH